MKQMLTSALFAGAAAGLTAALLHFAFVQEPLLLAERYEAGELVHGASHAAQGQMPEDPAAGAGAAAHDEAASQLSRNAFTVAFATLIYVAYGMLMVAGFNLAQGFGHAITRKDGVLWGVAGFAAFHMAPALGLPPELPGTVAAELAARQVWWWGTVAATIAGLASLAYGRSLPVAGLGILLLAGPHLVGAPHPAAMSGIAPPELAAEFAARALGVALIGWTVLGLVAGTLWQRNKADAWSA